MSDDIDPSQLKPIPGTDNYFAGPDGNIWSRPRRGGSREWRKVKPFVSQGGYLMVELRDGPRKRKRNLVAGLVLRAFKEEPPPGKTQCCHADGDKTNNRPENLYWGDVQDQIADRIKHGTIARGERASGSKLTQAYVNDLRRRAESGEEIDVRAEAVRMGVIQQTIRNVLNYSRWKFIDRPVGPREQTPSGECQQTPGEDEQTSTPLNKLLDLWLMLSEGEQQEFLSKILPHRLRD